MNKSDFVGESGRTRMVKHTNRWLGMGRGMTSGGFLNVAGIVIGGSLLVATAARADGGISALGGILDMFLLMIGAGGLVIFLLMFAIIGAQKERRGTSIGTKTGIVVSVAYVLLAAFFFAASSESPLRLIPAFTGGGTIALLCVYMYRLGDRS